MSGGRAHLTRNHIGVHLGDAGDDILSRGHITGMLAHHQLTYRYLTTDKSSDSLLIGLIGPSQLHIEAFHKPQSLVRPFLQSHVHPQSVRGPT